MLRQIGYRLLISIPAIFGVIVVGFILVMLVPTDPASIITGEDATAEALAETRARLGLDQPLWHQFLLYVGRLAQGDLGHSILNGASVAGELARAVPATAELVLASLIWAIPLGMLLGTLASLRPGRMADRLIMLVSVIGVSTPIFMTGLLALRYLAYPGSPFAAQGRAENVFSLEEFSHLALPAITLGWVLLGPIARMTRTSMLEVLTQDFIRTARAKGIRESRVIVFHALRNALLPTITLIGLQAGHLLGGTVVSETIFAWPGVGRLAVAAISTRDQAMAQGAILVVAVAFVVVNLIVDLLSTWLDPRVRLQ